MQEQVIETLTNSFAADLWETVKAARKHRDENMFRHTMFEDKGMMVFTGLFPKGVIREFPGVTEDFMDKLTTFNLIGVITDSQSRLELFNLGGQTKPFTSLEKPDQLTGILDAGQLMPFLQEYFNVRGMDLDLEAVTKDDLLKFAEDQVSRTVPMSAMSELAKTLLANEEK